MTAPDSPRDGTLHTFTYQAVPARQAKLRTPAEIAALRDQAEDNIHTYGWDPKVDILSQVLSWVLDDAVPDSRVRAYLDTPVAERREAWIAAGGNPADWTIDDHS